MLIFLWLLYYLIFYFHWKHIQQNMGEMQGTKYAYNFIDTYIKGSKWKIILFLVSRKMQV